MRRIARWLVPALVVLAWVALAGAGGPFFGRLSEVQSQSQADFLPESAEATRVVEIQGRLEEGAAPPAVIVATAPEGLTPEDLGAIETVLDHISGLAGVDEVSPPVPAEGGDPAAGTVPGAQAFAAVTGDPAEVVAEIREILDDLPDPVTAQVTGPAGFSADLSGAFGAIDSILLLVAVAAVFVILLIVYRSPVLPILVLLSSLGALATAVVAVYLMADAGWIDLNGQAQGILFILVIGAATDYALLLIARYRDGLREEPDPLRALRRALRGVAEPILASAGTVIAGLMCLLLSDLSSNQALGPVASVGVVCAVLASMTFLPGLLALTRRAAFFPFVPHPPSGRTGTEEGVAANAAEDGDGTAGGRHVADPATRGAWARLAALTGRHPRRLWISATAFLVVAAAFAPGFRASGVPESEFLLGDPESVAGQETLAELFPAGTGSPVVVIGAAEEADALVEALEAEDGVADVALGGSRGTGAPDETPTTEVAGREVVQVQGTLTDPPDSDAALATVERLRESLPSVDEGVLVGGESAIALDTRETASQDLRTIIPIVLAVIAVILMALLRSVVAPLLLVVATTVSYLSALGIAALVFEHLFDFPGADPVVPLFAFVFLVALGIDYSIFLSTRIREESLVRGTRPGILEGLRVTGGVITSAGVVLAATFAALAVIPLLFLVQLAFIVALGVLIDTLVVRSLVVPGLFHDIGPAVWWPSRHGRDPDRSGGTSPRRA